MTVLSRLFHCHFLQSQGGCCRCVLTTPGYVNQQRSVLCSNPISLRGHDWIKSAQLEHQLSSAVASFDLFQLLSVALEDAASL